MPNYVQNELEIDTNGDKILLESVLEYIKNNDEVIDFDKIKPMPNELKGTSSPANIVKDEELEKKLKEHSTGIQSLGGRPISESESFYLKKKYGYDNWYDWCNANWGTKWNTHETTKYENTISFQTAWSSPAEIIQELSAYFNTVVFKVRFADEDMGSNCGEYHYLNGNVSYEYYPPSGTDEAMRFAIEVQGYDYDEYMADQKDFEEEEAKLDAHREDNIINSLNK